MTTVALPPYELAEQIPLSLDEQQSLFQEALKELSETKLYACIEWLGNLKWLTPVQFALKKIDIKNAFGKTLNIRDLISVVTAEARRQAQLASRKKLDIAHVAIQWAHTHHDQWGYDIVSHTWYQWAGSHWQALEEEAGKPSPLDNEAIDTMHQADIAVNSNQALNCFRRVAASYCKRDFHEDITKINFANGTFVIATQHMQAHQRNDNITYCLNYTYDPTGSHPEIDTYLERTIPDQHARQSIIAHIGLALLRDTSFHNFGLMLGPPRAGKSTVLALMNATCGMTGDPFNFAGPSLFSRDLEGKRSRAKWVGFRGVCADELPAEALREEEILKAMSAHSGVEMRLIGKDERTDNRWKPKLLMSTNDTPHYKDVSGAIRQRVLIISCPNGPMPEDQQDKNLFDEKLRPEIGAFAATCIQYALEVRQRGSYPRSAQMRKTLDEIEHLGNPLKAFIRECCVLDPNGKIASDLLHKNYAEYITEGGNSPMAKNKMSASIRDMHIGVSVGEWMRFNGKPTRCLKGIRLRNDYDGDPDEPGYSDDPLLFSLQPPPPGPGEGNQEITVLEEAATLAEAIVFAELEPEPQVLDYPECMTQNMEPSPETPCPTCKKRNYAPYWGQWGTKQWGCASCFPEIPKRLGLYNPYQPPK